jgi:predicted RNA-binding Zn-ribbon protein involved in translation (DUF1610 family)
MLTQTRKCPDCGSVNVKLWVGGRLGMIYECVECGYRGPVVVDEDVEN